MVLVQVLGQAVVHAILCPILLVWSVLFWLSTLVSRGNAVRDPKVIVITGASSGLGLSLALKYASPGVTLGLSGRSKERLEDISHKCQRKGAKTKLLIMDVNNTQQAKQQLLQFDSEYPIDILIANAGVSLSTCESSDDPEASFFSVFETNTLGVANCIVPLLPSFIKRGKGQIVIMGSLAGDTGPLAGSSNPYVASKAAVASMAASWRIQLKQHNVGVTHIKPGFVKTPLTDKNDFSMPFLMDAKSAAEIMVSGISKDLAEVSYPNLPTWGIWILRIIPLNLASMVLRKA